MSIPWTDAAVRTALGLRGEHAQDGVRYTGVTTDSRDVTVGQLYVALVGERFDGHDFVADAVSKGALGAVVSRPAPGADDVRVYPVADTLVALGSLAAHRRRELAAPVVAITGSSGKTTTKDLTAAAVGAERKVHATRGNLNNRIGMPLTLLAAPSDAEAIVLEMGTNEPGEIRALAQIARPDIGVITTVGESHLEKLGSVEGVLDEKLDLLRNLAENGRCLVGDEPEMLAERAHALCPRLKVAGWSERADADLRPRQPDVDVFGRWEFRWKGCKVVMPLAGRHAVSDALLALAIADLLVVPPKEAVRGLAQAQTAAMRGQIRRIGDLTVIIDCYNANPQSVRAALDVLEHQGAVTQKVAVLGTMLELGAASDALHRAVLADVLTRDIDLVVATGAFGHAAHAIGSAGSERVITGGEWREVYPLLRTRLRGDDIVLLKASRGVALEGILPLLERDFASAPANGWAEA
jgi:UDP-N-acetylmuramoyl-tripeptide--D-alanyl-D-alanine ligase